MAVGAGKGIVGVTTGCAGGSGVFVAVACGWAGVSVAFCAMRASAV
jgi:hypothetical protein